MMVADTSALIAVAAEEPGYLEIHHKMETGAPVLISAATLLELHIVAMGKGPAVRQRVLELLAELSIVIVPFDETQAELAADAYDRYGKGRGHPAQLNFGDTFAYALASVRGLPLLYKGEDFARTDIATVA
ncbi:MAG: type II toxin-antitoxin system VapC family toxin [Chloroflexota bacterium]|nr:type II toxin-antitoxin system VapC family toxin [Chloroflexota bacterium]MDE2959843.1 type II toxin-antitoxin system VapC family toxin [Chloroflexota bacterium]